METANMLEAGHLTVAESVPVWTLLASAQPEAHEGGN